MRSVWGTIEEVDGEEAGGEVEVVMAVEVGGIGGIMAMGEEEIGGIATIGESRGVDRCLDRIIVGRRLVIKIEINMLGDMW